MREKQPLTRASGYAFIPFDQEVGGDDTIFAGADDDVAIGGFGNDLILGGAQGDDIILGDNGLVVGADGSAEAYDIITSGYLLGGGDDRILDQDGHNIIIGGDANDNLTGGGQRDWIAGDYADVRRGSDFIMEEFVSISDAQGGIDGISGRGGSDVIIAGAAGDIASGHSGNDIVLGDNGRILANGDTILSSETTSLQIGGADTLFGNTNDDIVIGGHGGDVIDGGEMGNDVILGDNGRVNGPNGTSSANDILTTGYTVRVAANDQISVADGSNLLVGGVGMDVIDGGSDEDLIVGDYADIIRDSGNVVTNITTIEPSLGHDDTIRAGRRQ